MTATEAVSTLALSSAPAGTEVPPHSAPQPYIVIVLAGEGEVEISDGGRAATRWLFRDASSGARVLIEMRGGAAETARQRSSVPDPKVEP